ncbi:DUF262 domain-containing HNH endonuclease family protein [Chitinophaga sancti]|uniref:DUF262 domain-containing protein n=1 Tax=Chitinophaga sancti TaxID=1004 RepID=UPI002A7488FE|nr:DUF262 domain-containing HNH endonuclease family protein [Chitinophaga sancti]WPQ63665.1 DUF262 domain-containing HNH endonuclease family protein [Chitinophaga sancti]
MNSTQNILQAKNIFTENIQTLFTNAENIRIPEYQRAYSWERKQCSQFLDDLLEQRGKRYYLGQFLFEKVDNTLYIIDGQQRLTTTILLLSAIAKIKNKKGKEVSKIQSTYLTDVFRTIGDDQIVFKQITQRHLMSKKDDTDTISQRRLIEAFSYFEQYLLDVDEFTIDAVQQTLEEAVISTFFICSKVEATQVFEYQNNRGKDLSRFEIIKAYLMHQVYIQSENVRQANSIIADIQTAVASTYRYFEVTEGYFTESELLDYSSSLFYSINGNIESIKEKLIHESDKLEWIKGFFENFAGLSLSAKSIVKNKAHIEIANLFLVGNEVKWQLVLLTLFYKGETSGDFYTKILKLLEVLCFKLKLGDYRSDHLPTYAKNYFSGKDGYDIERLYQDIKKATEIGFNWYWNDQDRFKNIIHHYFGNGKWHYDPNTIKFVLWQYENAIRIANKSGALLDKEQYEGYTIEHIKPQNPKEEQYTEDFRNNFLHLAGNLALLTVNQNSKFSNKSFEKKRELFQDTALSSYTEIREKIQWTEQEIAERHQKISAFTKSYFDTAGL